MATAANEARRRPGARVRLHGSHHRVRPAGL